MTRLLYCSMKLVWEASGEYYTIGSWPEFIPSLASYFDETYLMVPVLRATPDKLMKLSKFKDNEKLKFIGVRDIPLRNTPLGKIFPSWSLVNLNVFRDLQKKAEVTLMAIPHSIPYLAYLPMKDKPLIAYVAGDQEETLSESDANLLWKIAFPKLANPAQKYLLGKADVVICRNHKFKQKLVDKYHVLESRIYVVAPEGVKTDFFKPLDLKQIREIRSSLKLDNSLVIGFVSVAISVAKGGNIILKVFQEIRKNIPNVKLLLIGEDRIGIPNDESIIYLGSVRREELPSYYNIMDVFICSSLSEQGPKVVMEAAACGIPVISSNVGCIGDLAKVGKGGLLVDVGDADGIITYCRSLLEDKNLRIQMGRKAREYAAKHFDSAKLVRKTAEAIKSVL